MKCHLFAIMMMLMILGCQSNKPIQNVASENLSSLSPLKPLFELTFKNLKSEIDSVSPIAECVQDSINISCNAKNGFVSKFESWDVSADSNSDGDCIKYSVLGHFKRNTRFVIIAADLCHDSPTIIFWDRNAGGLIPVGLGSEKIYFSNDAESMISVVLNENVVANWDYWRNLNDSVAKFHCNIVSGTLKIDSFVSLTNPAMKTKRLDLANLAADSGVYCKMYEMPFDTVVPDYMKMPQNKNVVE